MAHELAGALQQALRIGNLGATKKAHVDVSFEGIDIGGYALRRLSWSGLSLLAFLRPPLHLRIDCARSQTTCSLICWR